MPYRWRSCTDKRSARESYLRSGDLVASLRNPMTPSMSPSSYLPFCFVHTYGIGVPCIALLNPTASILVPFLGFCSLDTGTLNAAPLQMYHVMAVGCMAVQLAILGRCTRVWTLVIRGRSASCVRYTGHWCKLVWPSIVLF